MAECRRSSSAKALARLSEHGVAREGDEGGADELQRCTGTSRARGQEEEDAAARTEPVGYSSPMGARRRAPARRLREGETAPGERRQRGLAVGHDEAREHDEPRRGPSKTSLSSRPWRARAVVTA